MIGDKIKPDWVGDDLLSRLVNVLIQTKPIYNVMKHPARQVGGYVAMVDNNPKSPVIQNLSPVLFTLMKSTEPWSDDYYTLDVERLKQRVGFEHSVTVASDPRHRTIIGRKPE